MTWILIALTVAVMVMVTSVLGYALYLEAKEHEDESR